MLDSNILPGDLNSRVLFKVLGLTENMDGEFNLGRHTLRKLNWSRFEQS
jgi:hypothetical protein